MSTNQTQPPRPEDAHKLLRGNPNVFCPTRETLEQSLHLACGWLTDIAQIKHRRISDEPGVVKSRFTYDDYRGAIKGEYSAASGEWSDFCPIWHSGQAAAALVQASRLLGRPEWVDAAKSAADFILRNQIADPKNEDFGMIAAFEGEPGWLNSSAVIESLGGLLELYKETQEDHYLNACRNALQWLSRKMYVPEEGLFKDIYIPAERRVVAYAYNPSLIGRPLLDDAMFLRIGKLCGDREMIKIQLRVAERLLRDEGPAGNWIQYDPCVPEKGLIHPRQAYWWGMPFIDVYQETQDRRHLEAAIRSGQWYTRAQRRDGAIMRNTYTDFNTYSFGHAASGAACAVKFWVRLWAMTHDPVWFEPMKRGLEFCMKMQISSCRDANLKGVVVEKVNMPNGTDMPQIYIRDLGTIFYIQAVCELIGAGILDKW